MTKKDHAENELAKYLLFRFGRTYHGSDLSEISGLIHAIDEADREERGVVDVQEISHCSQCQNRRYASKDDYFVCDAVSDGYKTLSGYPKPPPWCPRRKENRA